MFSWVLAIIAFFNNLMSLWKSWLNFEKARTVADDQEKTQRRDKAVDDAASAQTPDDAYNAEKGINDNRP